MENPYQPPQPIANEVGATTSKNADLASRWMRLWASLIDAVIGGAASLGIIFLVLGYDLKALAAADLAAKALMAVMGVVIFFALHGYLLAKNGQTIGKLICKIRTAKLDGSIPEFLPLILKRYVPIWLVVQIPVLGGLINLVNVCFIFRADRRCVHDLIAGTKVVQA